MPSAICSFVPHLRSLAGRASRFTIGTCCLLAASTLQAQSVPDKDPPLETILVTATLRAQALADTPASVTVLDGETLHAAGVQHAEDVLGLIPNLNWAAGTSRPRYFQLRGIGERDQYQGAPSSSVGFLIDDVDFSGVAMPAMLFDVEQLEVLRGPQGTSDGANALAGLIKLKTRDPRPQYEFRGEASGGDFGTSSVGAVVGGPLGLDNDSAFRVVAQRYKSDGFRDNVFLHRDDTNGFDEINTRAKLRLDLGEHWRVDLLGLYADQDNGYDAWSLDNSRVTRSDYPGRDAQRSRALEARVTFDAANGLKLESITTYSALDIVYSFDDDWADNGYWQRVADYSPYSYYSDIRRQRRTRSEDLRLSSVADGAGLGWVVGLYAINLREGNGDLEFAQDISFDPVGSASILTSDYDATSTAAYGQLEYAFTPSTEVTGGLRWEHRDASYLDSDGADLDTGESMLGGNLSLTHRLNEQHSVHVALARGYKAGGFNIGLEVPESKRRYAAEYLWNIEVGDRHTWAEQRVSTDVTLFYMRREHQQVSSSTQDPANPASFIFVTDNAARGENYGVESSATWNVSKQWRLLGTLAWLRARYLDYRYVDPNTDEHINLSGREQAHAPEYQYSLSAEWRHPLGFSVRADLTGVAPFYFSSSDNQQSDAYRLVNLRAGYERDRWSASLWSRNLFNAYYAQRGFYFGLEPPDYPNKLYRHHGDPRQFGATVEWRFE